MDIVGRFLLTLVFALSLYALAVLYILGGLKLVIASALAVHMLLRCAERLQAVERAIQAKAVRTEPMMEP